MRKIAIILFVLLCGCNENVQEANATVVSGKEQVVINGKTCSIVKISRGFPNSDLFYVDCGPCENSSLSFREGKHDVFVAQSPSSSCSCPSK
jgi:hypothetical protein